MIQIKDMTNHIQQNNILMEAGNKANQSQDNQVHIKQELRGKHFRITHTELIGNKIYRTHLTFDKTHKILNKNFAEMRPESNQNMDSQYWEFIHQSNQKEFFRIKNVQADVYLTLFKSDQKQNFGSLMVELLPFDKESDYQLWNFSLGDQKRYKFSPKSENETFLQSPESNSNNEFKAVCICRPDNEQLKWNQIWKLSPKKQNKLLSVYNFTQEQKLFGEEFQGKYIIQRTQNSAAQYFKSIQQYASQSYNSASRMRPLSVVYPKTEKDIRIILFFAQKLKLKVVTRSGGHQYCGLSSGGKDTILISMNQFNKFGIGEKNLLEVQPCVTLNDLSKKLVELNASIPHGQCFLVNIGGHAQTGGWGNLLRGFGLCTDYVEAFDIILADEKNTRRVTRPKQGVSIITEQDKLNQLIFRGVLSGNAGSFGVVTKYYFNYIKDADHPQSRGFIRVKMFSKQLFTALMYKYQQWSKLVQQDKDQNLNGIDMLVTVSKFQTPFFIRLFQKQVKTITISAYYQDPLGGQKMNSELIDLQKTIDSFGNWQDKIYQPLLRSHLIGKAVNIEQKTPLSILAHKSVFRPPAMKDSGKQFNLPYIKRCNVTMSALKTQFITKLVDKVVQIVYKHDQINFVSQMNLGGGACKTKGRQQIDGLTITCIPQREYIFNFTFDLFYKSAKGRTNALIIQEDMKQLVRDTYNTEPNTEKRYFWASFGEEQELDITNEHTVKMYYDSKQQYEKLQELKRLIDPKDLFHTSLTVKP